MNLKKSILPLLGLIFLIAMNFNHFEPVPISQEYIEWKDNFGVKLSPQEDVYRSQVFASTLKHIQEHNAKDSTYQLGINQFSHLTPEEFAEQHLSTYRQLQLTATQDQTMSETNEIDWEKQGYVSPVKSQGNCDAGYAFSTSSLFESYLLVTSNKAILSDQQIIDCSKDYDNMGCSGGSRLGTLHFIKEKGLVTYASYPFKGVQGPCQKPQGDYKAPFQILEVNGCSQLSSGLNKSPFTIAVDAKNWQSYRSGIFNNCDNTGVNHDLYLIGVTSQYWRLKNSWGVRWGQYGYIRLAPGNTCGVCLRPGYGFVR